SPAIPSRPVLVPRRAKRAPSRSVACGSSLERAPSILRPDAPVRTKRADVSQASELQALARDADIVLSAVPGFMGFRRGEGPCVLQGPRLGPLSRPHLRLPDERA